MTINTDDPSISNTTLSDEFMIAVLEIGVDISQVVQIIFNGIDAAFLSRQEKEQLWNSFRTQLEACRVLSSPDDLAVEKLKLR